MTKELSKVYNPRNFEDRIYTAWTNMGCFRAEVDPKKTPYTIVMPPPNITGMLHMGHALDATLQDILIRWKRMSGYSALWIPGTDHAAIATEAKIVEDICKKGITKENFGRNSFIKYAWKWKKQYGECIVKQLKKLGSSCDWSRERFTMDDGCSKAVKEVFVKYYEKGLIYRSERIINWCPKCKTSLSDAEVTYEDQIGHFWHIRYKIKDANIYLELATTRPETLIGDTAIAVNPKDERYKHFVGKSVIVPLVNREIPIIADDYVEMDFGTGVVKITPAHDPNDFEVGLRHNLNIINIMNDDATIVDDYPKYAGLDRYDARKAIVEDLEVEGALVNIEDYNHNIGTCYRCGTTVEPKVSTQWFVKMKYFAQLAIDAVKNGDTKLVPKRFDKIYFYWLNNIHDWCISRQIWWGHQIPAFYCDTCCEITVTEDDNPTCQKCGKHMRQDPDTLDTWFSSALWPFSTLGWPEKTMDLDYFYPTNTLVTGYDIIFFWVIRMMFSGLENTGRVPFDTVFIHGLVRDMKGRKMSKSFGNGIDPIEVIDKYGADALRFMLATCNSPGNDIRYIDDKVKAARNFANKLWNASRFIIINLPDNFEFKGFPDKLETEDKWLINKFNKLKKEVNDNLKKYEIGAASQKIYDFIWNVYCDWYIELTKPRIQTGGSETMARAQTVLVGVMKEMLKLLHPFMPFITEEIWQVLTNERSMIIHETYPTFNNSIDFTEDEKSFEKVISAIKAVRNTRKEMNIPPSVKVKLIITTDEPELYIAASAFFEKLSYASSVEVLSEVGSNVVNVNCANAVTDSALIFIHMNEFVDNKAELARLKREKIKIKKDIDFICGKLNNQGFIAKAPEKIINGEKNKLKIAEEKMTKIEQSIKSHLANLS